MARIFWKISFCSLHFQSWFKFLEKVLIWLKNVTSIKKLLISKVESFWKSNFWPKSKYCLHKTVKPGTLTQLTWFIFLLKFIEMLWSYKKFQKIGVGRELDRIRTKNLLAQTISYKIFQIKWSNPVKLEIKRKVWYVFLRVF